jgi:hypothetical protein
MLPYQDSNLEPPDPESRDVRTIMDVTQLVGTIIKHHDTLVIRLWFIGSSC